MASEAEKIYGAPGTGKTTEAERRFAEAVKSGIPPHEILYSTYRKEAVASEKLKLSQLIGINVQDLKNVKTTHGMCLSLLLRNGNIDWRKDENSIIKNSDYYQFNRDCGYNVNPLKQISEDFFSSRNDPYLAFYSCLKSTRTPLREAYSLPCDFKKVLLYDLVEFAKDFDKWKAANNKIGFDDMVDMVLKEKLCPDCPVQIYDEAQDMTTQLYNVSKMWANEADLVILAGDPLQTLYPYQGANPGYFIDWHGETDVLPESRRLTSAVWSIASEIIELRTPYRAPDIRTKSNEGSIREIYHQNLQDWLSRNPKNPSSTVFHLVRTNYQGYEVAKTLAGCGIPFSGIAEYSWNSAEANLYNAIKKIQANEVSVTSERPQKKIQTQSRVQVRAKKVLHTQDKVRAIPSPDIKGPIKPSLTLSEFCAIIDAYAEKFLIGSYDRQELKEKAAKKDFKPDLKYFRPSLTGMISTNPIGASNLKGLPALKIEGALKKHLPEITPELINKVKILTIHGSKGMEADTVFLHTAISPTIARSLSEERGIENEAYVWYVGITRTRKNLFFVTYPGKNYPIPGVCA
ncbi:MAG: UvrD-helicase domain-containing protein [Syntrophothermus sp.]